MHSHCYKKTTMQCECCCEVAEFAWAVELFPKEEWGLQVPSADRIPRQQGLRRTWVQIVGMEVDRHSNLEPLWFIPMCL